MSSDKVSYQDPDSILWTGQETGYLTTVEAVPVSSTFTPTNDIHESEWPTPKEGLEDGGEISTSAILSSDSKSEAKTQKV